MRKNDRGFLMGDQLLLQEYHSQAGYTGREQLVTITHILDGEQFGVKDGFVCMSIRKVEK